MRQQLREDIKWIGASVLLTLFSVACAAGVIVIGIGFIRKCTG